jgi:hypothetical protein
MWAVMKAYKWSAVKATDGRLVVAMPNHGPQRFIPLFDTWKQAVDFMDGDKTYITMVELTEKEDV